MAGPRFHLVLLTTLAALVLCAALVPARADATEESAEPADDGTITTVLQPGWNMVGWLGADMDASEIFDQVPNLERVSAWDAENQRYQRRTRTSIARHGLRQLTPGRGLWLEIGGDEPVEWTRPASEESMLLELHAGRNLVGWAGRDGTPIEDAVARFGDTFVRASRWDAVAQQFQRYHPGRDSAATPPRDLTHGDALWVELTSDARWWQSGSAPPPVVFLGEFTDEERAEIGGWMDSARAVFAERWSVEAPITVYVGDRESVTSTYRRLRGSKLPTWTCGDSGRRIIFLWDCIDERSHAHAYFHAIQSHLERPRSANAPTWLVEGSAEYAASAYLGVLSGTRTASEQVTEDILRALLNPGIYDLPALDEIEGYSAFHSLRGVPGHRLGFVAVDWLVQQSADASIIDFFKMLAKVRRWQEVFEPAFGITVDDFYRLFARYRAAAAPRPPQPTDVGERVPPMAQEPGEPDLVFVGDIPLGTQAAVRREFEEQLAFFGERFGAGNADYTVYVGTDVASVRHMHLRLFLSEPPRDFCSGSAGVGAVLVVLNCSGARNHDIAEYHPKLVRQQLAPWTSLPPVPAAYDIRGPVWLIHAAEAYVEHAYQTAAGIEGPRGVGSRISQAIRTGQLRSLDTRKGFNEAGYRSARALSSLAGEWLAERAGEPALFEYYRLLPTSGSWEEAFEFAFGITVNAFYEAFEASRATVAPPLPHLADDSHKPVLVFVGDIPTETQTAIRAELDSLQAFFFERFRTGTADYTAFVAADDASFAAADARATGVESEIQLCRLTLHGSFVILSLECQQTPPHSLDAWHFTAVTHELASREMLSAPSGYDPLGPIWLIEAGQTYVEHAYRAAAGREAFDAIRSRETSLAARAADPLRALESWAGFDSERHWELRAVAFLAMEWLVEHAGEPAVFQYYRQRARTDTWEAAFEAAFGIAVDDFYEAFEAHRAEVAPPAS